MISTPVECSSPLLLKHSARRLVLRCTTCKREHMVVLSIQFRGRTRVKKAGNESSFDDAFPPYLRTKTILIPGAFYYNVKRVKARQRLRQTRTTTVYMTLVLGSIPKRPSSLMVIPLTAFSGLGYYPWPTPPCLDTGRTVPSSCGSYARIAKSSYLPVDSTRSNAVS
jgi:hypothetical protein